MVGLDAYLQDSAKQGVLDHLGTSSTHGAHGAHGARSLEAVLTVLRVDPIIMAKQCGPLLGHDDVVDSAMMMWSTRSYTTRLVPPPKNSCRQFVPKKLAPQTCLKDNSSPKNSLPKKLAPQTNNVFPHIHPLSPFHLPPSQRKTY